VNEMAKAKKKASKKPTKKKATKKKGAKKKRAKKKSASSGLSHWERMDDPLMYAGEAIMEEHPLVLPVIAQHPDYGWFISIMDFSSGELQVVASSIPYSTPGKAANVLGKFVLPGPRNTPTPWFKKATGGKFKRASGGDMGYDTRFSAESLAAANPCIGFHLHSKDFAPLLRALQEEGLVGDLGPQPDGSMESDLLKRKLIR